MTKVIDRKKSLAPNQIEGAATSKADVAAYIAELSGGLAQMAHRNDLLLAGHLLDMVRQDLATLQDGEAASVVPPDPDK